MSTPERSLARPRTIAPEPRADVNEGRTLGRAAFPEPKLSTHLAPAEPPGTSYEQLDLGLAWAAHELRAPLVGAMAALDHALDVGPDAERSGPLLKRAKQELMGLSNSLVDLLNSAMAAGPIRTRPVDLADVALSVAEMDSIADAPNRVRTVALDPQVVDADPVLLRSAISNLVRNALLYSPAGSRVVVTVDRLRSSARVRVRDRGPGVPAEEQGAIFDPFTRGRVGRQSAPGSGLGLFVTRKIVEGHGGRIWVTTSSTGSTFGFELPLEREGAIPSAS